MCECVCVLMCGCGPSAVARGTGSCGGNSLSLSSYWPDVILILTTALRVNSDLILAAKMTSCPY